MNAKMSRRKFLAAAGVGGAAVAAVAVTEEPAGGSVKATTAPLLIGRAVNN